MSGTTYYGGFNERILTRVPRPTTRILDVGCGDGLLGQRLKAEEPYREVWGIEIAPRPAAEAAKYLDHVLPGDIEKMDPLPLPESFFDCITCGDVLEHLREPGVVLHHLRKHIAPGGILIVNVPNVAHWSVVSELLQGRFTYEASGLLDRTHLRFFTPESLKSLLWEAGYVVTEGDALRLPDGGASKALATAAASVGLNPSLAESVLSVYQQLYVCKAEPDPHTDAEKLQALVGQHAGRLGEPSLRCSIVVVTFNSAGVLENLFRSLLPTLTPDDELILVDNASTDGTRDLLEKHVENHSKQGAATRLILNENNEGFSRGCNLGILESRGEHVVLLNPDTTVYPEWLDRLLAPFADPQVGAVGPLSDAVCGDQAFGRSFQDRSFSSPEEVAAELAAGRAPLGAPTESFETKLLVGFCLALRRDLLNKYGLLEERCFLGADDLEMSWRLRTLGYQLVVATDVFVAHQGNASFASLQAGEKGRQVALSDAALVRKLLQYYGPCILPSSTDLWGNPIFDGALRRHDLA